MINIYDSRTSRASSTNQDLLNDLAEKWDNFNSIVYDDTVTTNVKELWISDNIYIYINSSSRIEVKHTNGRLADASMVFNDFYLITTDYGFLVHGNLTASGDAAVYFGVTKTIDTNNNESYGAFVNISSNQSNITMISDNCNLDNQVHNARDWQQNSSVNTVLTPMYSITGDECYEGAYFVFMKKQNDKGKVLLNDRKYYIYHKVALEYT